MNSLLDNIVELVIEAITTTAGIIVIAIIYNVAKLPEMPISPKFRITLDNVVTIYNVANEIDPTAIKLALAIVSTIIATIIFLSSINKQVCE